VTLLVAWLAKPHDCQGLVIVFVVSKSFCFSTSGTWLSHQVTIPDGSGNTCVSHVPAGIFCSPCACNFRSRLDALWLFATRPVVSPYLFNIFIPIGCDIISVALLAFVDVTVSHSWVFVKLTQWLDGVAFKTTFHNWLLKANHTRFD